MSKLGDKLSITKHPDGSQTIQGWFPLLDQNFTGINTRGRVEMRLRWWHNKDFKHRKLPRKTALEQVSMFRV